MSSYCEDISCWEEAVLLERFPPSDLAFSVLPRKVIRLVPDEIFDVVEEYVPGKYNKELVLKALNCVDNKRIVYANAKAPEFHHSPEGILRDKLQPLLADYFMYKRILYTEQNGRCSKCGKELKCEELYFEGASLVCSEDRAVTKEATNLY